MKDTAPSTAPDSPSVALLLVLVFAYFSILFGRLVISPLVPRITLQFGVSSGAIGLALTGLWAAYGLLQLPGGIMAGTVGYRSTILLGIGLSLLGSLLLAASPNYPAFALSAVILGAGGGLYYPVATTVLTRAFENTGGAIGLHIGGGNVAGLVAPSAAVLAGARYGWRSGILLGTLVLAACVSVSVVYARTTDAAAFEPAGSSGSGSGSSSGRAPGSDTSSSPGFGSGSSPGSGTSSGSGSGPRVDTGVLVDLLSRPAIAFTVVLAVVASFTFQAVFSFFPTYLAEHQGYSPEHASALFSVIFALFIVSLPVFGRVSDVLPRDVVLTVVMLSLGSGIGLTVVGSDSTVVLAGVVLVGFGMGFGGVINSLFMDHLTPEEKAYGFGLVRTTYIMLGSLGNVVVGGLADLHGWSAGFGFLVVLLLVPVAMLALNRVVPTVGIGDR